MCKHKLLTAWPGHEEFCSGYSHTYRDRHDKPITPAMLGEDLAGTFRAMCPECNLPEEVEREKPIWETRAEQDARERRALVDEYFIYKDQTFENYNAAFNGHEGAVRNVQKFLDDERIKRLILKGDVGRGKSHLAQACINAARPVLGGHADMIAAGKFYWMLREVEGYEPDEIARKAYERLQRARMLALDDLGTEKQTDAQVFNQELKDLLETFAGRLIITTNLGDKEMRELYGEKITSRIYEDALLVVLKGKDYRLNK